MVKSKAKRTVEKRSGATASVVTPTKTTDSRASRGLPPTNRATKPDVKTPRAGNSKKLAGAAQAAKVRPASTSLRLSKYNRSSMTMPQSHKTKPAPPTSTSDKPASPAHFTEPKAEPPVVSESKELSPTKEARALDAAVRAAATPSRPATETKPSLLTAQLSKLSLQQFTPPATDPTGVSTPTMSSVSSDGPVERPYHQEVQGSNYEVKIQNEFISSKATPKGESGQIEGFQYPHSSSHKMSATDFEPLRYLGKGGFGTVVLVKQKNTGRLYAQKQLRKESLLFYKRGAECAKTERNVLESINRHNFMVKLYYAFQDEAKLYLLLEYAQGGELFKHLREERMLPETTVSFYLAEMVLAFRFLHEKVGVVYRDLKPENCLLDADGHLLLTDFGLCKEGMNDGERCSTFTGTISYMAPEVILGKDYGFPVDWWSLGAIGVDLLTGSPPFTGANHGIIRDKIVKSPLKLPPYVGPFARDFFLRLLKKDPAKRLGSNLHKDMKAIQSNLFFRNIDWARLARREMEPPIRPFITDPTLAENFDDEFTGVPVTPDGANFRSNIDELFHRRSRNPSPQKDRKGTPLGTLTGRPSRPANGPDGLKEGGPDDGLGPSNSDQDGYESDLDPDQLFGGFSFTAPASVFDDANFWVV